MRATKITIVINVVSEKKDLPILSKSAIIEEVRR